MRPIGFSTGAIALSDFCSAIEWQQRDDILAIELSALREEELDPLLNAIPGLELQRFKHRSIHAPSRLRSLKDADLADCLRPFAEQGFLIVVHPDIITDFTPWEVFEDRLLIENMDLRKPVCRTASEIAGYFAALPLAGFCFDIGHARQVDPTMGAAVEFLLRFGNRLRQIHISEVNWHCKHISIGTAAAIGFRRVARLLPDSVPVIIESMVGKDAMDRELQKVRKCLNMNEPFFRTQRLPFEFA